MDKILLLSLILSPFILIITARLIYKELISYCHELGDRIFGNFIGIIWGLLISGLVIFVSVLPGQIIGACLPNISTDYYQEIISVNNDNQINSFVLGSGYINEVEYYFYFVKTNDGGYIRGKIMASNVTIYENNEISPRLQWIKYIPKQEKITKYLFGDLSNRVYDNKDYKLIVPKGTIMREFKLK